MIKHKKRAAALNGAYVACIGNPTAQAREMVDSGILDGAAAVEEIHHWRKSCMGVLSQHSGSIG